MNMMISELEPTANRLSQWHAIKLKWFPQANTTLVLFRNTSLLYHFAIYHHRMWFLTLVKHLQPVYNWIQLMFWVHVLARCYYLYQHHHHYQPWWHSITLQVLVLPPTLTAILHSSLTLEPMFLNAHDNQLTTQVTRWNQGRLLLRC